MSNYIAKVGIVLMVFALIAPILQQSILEGAIPLSQTARYCFALTFILGFIILCGGAVSSANKEPEFALSEEGLATRFKK